MSEHRRSSQEFLRITKLSRTSACLSFNLNHSYSLTTQDQFAMLWRFCVCLVCLLSLYLENINEDRKKTKFSEEILFPRQRPSNWNKKASFFEKGQGGITAMNKAALCKVNLTEPDGPVRCINMQTSEICLHRNRSNGIEKLFRECIIAERQVQSLIQTGKSACTFDFLMKEPAGGKAGLFQAQTRRCREQKLLMRGR